MKTSDELFDKAKELAYEEIMDEASENIKMRCILGYIFLHSECCYDMEDKCESIITLLEEDWNRTRPETNKFPNQIKEARDSWFEVINSLDAFTAKIREHLKETK